MTSTGSELASRAIGLLEEYGLAEIEGRPFDNSFATFTRPLTDQHRLMVVGFNGSNADEGWTTKSTFEKGLEDPDFSNIDIGEKVGWNGKRRLARALKRIPNYFGLDWEDTIYTNAILACSQDAASLAAKVNNSRINGSVSAIKNRSMAFFRNFTMREFEPTIIVCHGNGETSFSTASILHEYLEGDEKVSLETHPFKRAYWFNGYYNGRKIPILCLRHMSRYRVNEDALRNFARAIMTPEFERGE